jgi:hypothetical protein
MTIPSCACGQPTRWRKPRAATRLSFGATSRDLLSGALDDGTPEVRWHLLALSARLRLTQQEARRLIQRLEGVFESDPSRIVRVTALEAAVEVATRHPELKGEARRMLDLAQTSPAPSVRARARKLASRVA